MKKKTISMTQLAILLVICLGVSFTRATTKDQDLPFVIEDEFRAVTCGTAVKLGHHESGFRLHSHAVKYGSGSGQQSVTAFPEGDDSNSYFRVLGPFGEQDCFRGQPVTCGSTVRLLHVNTQKYLHSHSNHVSPLSGSQEVSAYEKTDSGDNWKVDCVKTADKDWTREHPIRLYHVDTGMYLSAKKDIVYRSVIQGQLEVAGRASGGRSEVWVAQEGIYFASL